MKKILVLCFMLLSAIGFGQLSTVPMGVGTKLNVAFPIINTAIDQINVNTAAIAGFTGTGLGYENVQDYGALGNGSADDAAEIQAALTAGIGGTVYFPNGTYLIKSSLQVGSNTTIVGSGKENTIIFADTSFTDNSGMFTFLVNAKHITFKDLCIDGNNTNFTMKKGEHFGINTYNRILGSHSYASYVDVENVEIKNTSQFGVGLMFCNNWNFDNCYLHNTGDTINAGGFYLESVDNFTITSSIIDSTKQHGFYYDSGSNVLINNCKIRYSGYNPPGDDQATGISMRADSNVVITGNMVMYSKGYGLALMSNRTNFKKTPTKNVVVTGNVITHNRGNADDASQATVMVSGLYKSLIGNNTLGHSTGVNATNGVIRFIGDNSDVQIIGNNIYSSQFGILIASCDSLSNIDITNNVFGRGNNGALAMGIRVASCDQGNYMKIKGNTFYDGTTGIRIFSDFPSYMTIKDNEFYNTTYQVTNEGTIVNHNIEYKGVSAFTTTALRKAIFVDGMNTDYNIIVTPIATSTLGYPVAADLIVGFAKADSIVFLRSTGTTSGLTFKYVVNND